MSINYSTPEKYIGEFEQIYLGYATDGQIRNGAGSGGITSAVLVYLLENNFVDGVLTSRTIMVDGRVSAKAIIATTKQEVLDSRQSIYMDFNYTKSIREVIEFDGTIAMVGLPCHYEILKKMYAKYPILHEKIKYKIALFCSGVPKYNMIHSVLESRGIQESNIEKFYFRQGHWRGQMKTVMRDGTSRAFSYMNNYGIYKNSYFDMLTRCSLCHNHFGYDADLSVGDAWLKEMKGNPIKHNLFIAKSRRMNELIKQMVEHKAIYASPANAHQVLKAQKRPLIYKFYAAEARKKVGRWFGFDLNIEIFDKSKINHYVAAFFISLNMKMCHFPGARKVIYKIPKKLMFLYMGFIRLLLSR